MNKSISKFWKINFFWFKLFFIFFIIIMALKELLPLNEELILIRAFTLLIFKIKDFAAIFFSDELDLRSSQMKATFDSFKAIESSLLKQILTSCQKMSKILFYWKSFLASFKKRINYFISQNSSIFTLDTKISATLTYLEALFESDLKMSNSSAAQAINYLWINEWIYKHGIFGFHYGYLSSEYIMSLYENDDTYMKYQDADEQNMYDESDLDERGATWDTHFDALCRWIEDGKLWIKKR